MPLAKDLKSTLNLPKTAFPMKASLPQSEPRQLAAWEESRLYHRIQEARAGAPAYVLHDGPPYPTGEIHLGTGLNKILKDMVVKSKTMAGFRSPYVPGWDCHGLPIETKVEKELGGKGKVPPAEFRRMCREFAGRYIENHRREFKRLGIFGLWEKPYLTMDFGYEACIAEAFLTFLEKGYIYRGLKPVYWCIFDATALAEAEVEYEVHTSPSIWVRYEVVETPQISSPSSGTGRCFAITWTTTPWTLPASMALAFNKNIQYSLAADDKGDAYIVATDLIDRVAQETGLRFTGGIVDSFPGSVFVLGKFRHPFLDRIVPGVLGDHVTLEQGSGIVHTAPGHGAEDFYTGQEYGLETYAPLDDEGRFTEGLAEYRGKTVFEANSSIIDLLKSRGALIAQGKLTHSYPHCWRCHNPVIFRATEQWFINLEHANFRQRALEEIRKVKWTPAWGQERITDMVANRPDWCVSRQRFWGVPLIIFTCEQCGQHLKDFTALRHVIPWFEREGADAWFSRPAEELLPPGTKCPCGAAKWRKESDILDVWFDSGSSHLAALNPPNGEKPACDMYLEGPDQFRGWFQSSLLVGVGVRNVRPYQHVLTHGWTLDEKGAPMSKSLGNAIYPAEICEKWGADLLRVWVSSQDYTADMRMSERGMAQLVEAYRKLRNTFRFALGNLDGFDPSRDALPDAELWEMDRWMLHRTAELVRQCRAWYEEFEFHRVFHAVHDFATVELSAFYFDLLKDRLYTFAPRNVGRRSAQTTVYRIADALLRLITPVLVFTAEEIWKYFPRSSSDSESVHLLLFPNPEDVNAGLDSAVVDNWNRLLILRSAALQVLEQARQSKLINANLDARVTFSATGETASLLRKYSPWLPAFLIVSQVDLADAPSADSKHTAQFEGFHVSVRPADGTKCERCWNYSTHVGENSDYPTICERCVAALAEIEQGTLQ